MTHSAYVSRRTREQFLECEGATPILVLSVQELPRSGRDGFGSIRERRPHRRERRPKFVELDEAVVIRVDSIEHLSPRREKLPSSFVVTGCRVASDDRVVEPIDIEDRDVGQAP